MILAEELQMVRVYDHFNWQGMFIPSKRIKRVRKFALLVKHDIF